MRRGGVEWRRKGEEEIRNGVVMEEREEWSGEGDEEPCDGGVEWSREGLEERRSEEKERRS